MAEWRCWVVVFALALQLVLIPHGVEARRVHVEDQQVSYYDPQVQTVRTAGDETTASEETNAVVDADAEFAQTTADEQVAEQTVQPALYPQRQYAAYQQFSSFPSVNNYQTQLQQQDTSLLNLAASGNQGVAGNIPYALTGGGCPTLYWVSNIHRWPQFFSVSSKIGDAFGKPGQAVFGDTTLLQGLLDTRPEGYHSLLSAGSAAILNAYSRSKYTYTHTQVMDMFNQGLSSLESAAMTAAAFAEANKSSYTMQADQCN